MRHGFAGDVTSDEAEGLDRDGLAADKGWTLLNPLVRPMRGVERGSWVLLRSLVACFVLCRASGLVCMLCCVSTASYFSLSLPPFLIS